METKKKEAKILPKKYIAYGIFGALVVLLVAFKLSSLLSLDAGNITIESNLEKENKKVVEKFIKLSLKDEFIPKAVNLVQMPANATSEANLITEHFATWEVGEEVFSLLYVEKRGESKPDFIRLWTLNFEETTTKERSVELFKAYFKESYVQLFEKIECTEIEGIMTLEKVVECGQMKIAKPADLLGVAVKGPVPISEGFFGQSVSVCLIPDGVLRGYPFKNCI